jgi:hypothetical protein
MNENEGVVEWVDLPPSGKERRVNWWDQIMANDFHPDPDRPGYFITDSGMQGAATDPEVEDDE